ncbi:MAG: T9SS type A sorting domain-containing protein [Bacteroidales bacterium]|jgi:hypothetical protein|nr:T9SS type A sorting domain-containing protein [Bacteroidales bacterium]MDD3702375.1 T9SS type A sorting domain-containing protein [Bacteroidales bacterium]MDY0369148.1 T9SS type A sorting domain-containing protein [Bacteroidales bacterium]
MRKVLLLTLVLGLGLTAFAQRTYKLKSNLREHQAIEKMMIGIEPTKATSMISNQQNDAPAFLPQYKNTNAVTIIDIGTSANAYSYSYAGGQKEIVAAAPEVNVVTNFHRMGGALDPAGYSGDLGYDISFDGGLTWTNMIEIYTATNNAGGEYYTDAGRYPSHGLYNPVGNTDIENVWLQFHAPNLDGSNSPESWGGYSYGVANITDPENTNTKNLQSSVPPFYQYIVDAYDITRTGKVFAVDVNQDWGSGSVVYKGSLIVNEGTWDEDEFDFVFTRELLDAPVAAATTRPAHVKVAFSEDGNTGYISMIGDNESATVISGSPGYYPIIFKTTDGGESWSDPVGIQLAGPNGLPGIIEDLLTDDQIAQLYEEPLPARDQIPYTTAFDHDIVVDADGNLHIGVVIGVVGNDDYSIVSAEYLFAAYDIFTTDGGTTWHAIKLGNIRQFRGEWDGGDFNEDNRIQVSISPDRETVFVLWLDSDAETAESNNRPNIFARGVRANQWGTADLTCDGTNPVATNVTMFSAAMWSAPFHAVASKSFFADGKYTIPIAFQPLAPEDDPGAPVQYKYITDFYFTDADFCIVGSEEIKAVEALQVSQNFPNPFSNETYITVNLAKGSQLNIEVYNLTGQKVYDKKYGYKPAGQTSLVIQDVDFPTGIYFYTVQAGTEKITRKMIVN